MILIYNNTKYQSGSYDEIISRDYDCNNMYNLKFSTMMPSIYSFLIFNNGRYYPVTIKNACDFLYTILNMNKDYRDNHLEFKHHLENFIDLMFYIRLLEKSNQSTNNWKEIHNIVFEYEDFIRKEINTINSLKPRNKTKDINILFV